MPVLNIAKSKSRKTPTISMSSQVEQFFALLPNQWIHRFYLTLHDVGISHLFEFLLCIGTGIFDRRFQGQTLFGETC